MNRARPLLLAGALLAIGVTIFGAVLRSQSIEAAIPGGPHDSNGNTGQYWSTPEPAFHSPRQVRVDTRAFYLGDTVVMPNGLQLQVTRVERNWQPPAAVAATIGQHQDGDNPAGREIVLVHFIATDVGSSALAYNDSMFTLQRAGRPEQRVAVLATLQYTDYGSRGSVPWLLPGQRMETFVPFLITPGEHPLSFQYYLQPPLASASKDQAAAAPLPTLSRLSVQLDAPQGRPVMTLTYAANGSSTVGG